MNRLDWGSWANYFNKNELLGEHSSFSTPWSCEKDVIKVPRDLEQIAFNGAANVSKSQRHKTVEQSLKQF